MKVYAFRFQSWPSADTVESSRLRISHLVLNFEDQDQPALMVSSMQMEFVECLYLLSVQLLRYWHGEELKQNIQFKKMKFV